ncbi:MAG: MarR family transcriptional regulator [Clostridiales bacterium]|nr:MarR family transcriptional regulator [Clostridiales bacterium]
MEQKSYLQDDTERKITKIARELTKFTNNVMRETGLGSAEVEFIHCVRHNPGISQKELSEKLSVDKAAIARRSANLIKKGYLTTKIDENDARKQNLFATEAAEKFKKSRVEVESMFYAWLMEGIEGEEKKVFLEVLDKIYEKSKKESKEGFPNLYELEGEIGVK